MMYIAIVFLIILTFFVGFGVGLSIPFLLKKYFNISESNLNRIEKIQDEFNNKITEITDNIDKKFDDINSKIESVNKEGFMPTDLYKEWMTGIESRSDENG